MENNGQIENLDDGGEVINFDPMAWRNELQPDARTRAVSKIMGIVKRLFPVGNGLPPFRRLCVRIEEDVYKTATSRAEYLRMIDESKQSLEAMNPRPSNGNPQQVMDAQDWRIDLRADARQRIINKITDIFVRHFPLAGPEGFLELNMIAIGLEVKIYTTATSQAEYLRMISTKMIMVERDYPLPPNEADIEQIPSDEEVDGMEADVEDAFSGNYDPDSI